MCWMSYNQEDLIPKIAKEDIIVYKTLRVKGFFNKHFSVCTLKRYKKGKKNEQQEIYLNYDNPKSAIIQRGYHSVSGNNKISKIAINKRLLEGWFNDALFDCGNVLAQFVIPKGTKYYENEQGLIVSENIVYIKDIINLAVILDKYNLKFDGMSLNEIAEHVEKTKKNYK